MILLSPTEAPTLQKISIIPDDGMTGSGPVFNRPLKSFCSFYFFAFLFFHSIGVLKYPTHPTPVTCPGLVIILLFHLILLLCLSNITERCDYDFLLIVEDS